MLSLAVEVSVPVLGQCFFWPQSEKKGLSGDLTYKGVQIYESQNPGEIPLPLAGNPRKPAAIPTL